MRGKTWRGGQDRPCLNCGRPDRDHTARKEWDGVRRLYCPASILLEELPELWTPPDDVEEETLP